MILTRVHSCKLFVFLLLNCSQHRKERMKIKYQIILFQWLFYTSLSNDQQRMQHHVYTKFNCNTKNKENWCQKRYLLFKIVCDAKFLFFFLSSFFVTSSFQFIKQKSFFFSFHFLLVFFSVFIKRRKKLLLLFCANSFWSGSVDSLRTT